MRLESNVGKELRAVVIAASIISKHMMSSDSIRFLNLNAYVLSSE